MKIRLLLLLLFSTVYYSTALCSKKKLRTVCYEDEECCSGLCTGRKESKKRCRFCARKKETCSSNDDCCQTPSGRYCDPILKICSKCPASGCNPEQTSTSTVVEIESPFPTTVKLFTEEVIQPYKSDSDVAEDLKNASWFLLNNVVERNLGTDGYKSIGIGRPMTSELISSLERTDVSSEANSNPDDDDFGTNNQEDGVEEGDLVVSDGENVFAAYGDYVVSWKARSGDMFDSVRMPSIKEIDEEFNENPAGLSGTLFSVPYIESLLLYEDLLVVFVSGYGAVFRHSLTTREFPIMYDYLATHIRIYNTSTLNDVNKESLELVGVKNVNGRFNAVREVEGSIHVVTSTGIDVHTDLIRPFERWNYEEMSDDEYIEMVERAATEKAIPKFIEGLSEELKASTGVLPRLSQISLQQTVSSDGSQLERLAFGEGLVNNLVQVFSFDLSNDEDDADAEDMLLSLDATGTFLPTYWSQVYSSGTDLIIASEGWEYNETTGTSQEATYLLGIDISESSTRLQSVGHLAGRVLNSYSMDVYQGTLRIATTIRNILFLPLPILPVVRPILVQPLPVEEELAQPITVEEDELITVTEEEEEEDLVLIEPESTTRNYVTMLEMKEGQMEQLGRVRLGKPNEVFTAVRFFDNIAYAVTFERTDPFYVLNLQNPTAPQVLGELNITGFSSYLHSMNDDNSLILAIGQEADEEGVISGMKVTVFDSTVPQEPVAVQNYVIEDDLSLISGSEALRNFRAARYALGRLIIPLDIYDRTDPGNNFRGFLVLIANETTIEEECRISHSEEEQDGTTTKDDEICFYCASLPRRAMIFDGLVMTTDKRTVQRTDTSTCTTVWTEEIDVPDTSGNCCGF